MVSQIEEVTKAGPGYVKVMLRLFSGYLVMSGTFLNNLIF